MSTFSIDKDPQSVLDYSITYADIMALTSPNDTIFSSSWAGSDGLVVDSNSKTDTTTTVFVSGGRVGAYCNLVNTIVTTADRTYERTIVVEIKNK